MGARLAAHYSASHCPGRHPSRLQMRAAVVHHTVRREGAVRRAWQAARQEMRAPALAPRNSRADRSYTCIRYLITPANDRNCGYRNRWHSGGCSNCRQAAAPRQQCNGQESIAPLSRILAMRLCSQSTLS